MRSSLKIPDGIVEVGAGAQKFPTEQQIESWNQMSSSSRLQLSDTWIHAGQLERQEGPMVDQCICRQFEDLLGSGVQLNRSIYIDDASAFGDSRRRYSSAHGVVISFHLPCVDIGRWPEGDAAIR